MLSVNSEDFITDLFYYKNTSFLLSLGFSRVDQYRLSRINWQRISVQMASHVTV